MAVSVSPHTGLFPLLPFGDRSEGPAFLLACIRGETIDGVVGDALVVSHAQIWCCVCKLQRPNSELDRIERLAPDLGPGKAQGTRDLCPQTRMWTGE